MSVQITTAFVKQYGSNVAFLTQQKGSKLRGTLMEETMVGKEKFMEQIGAVSATKRTGRHEDTQYSNTPHDRRRLTTETYDWADLIDEPDKIRMLIDPKSPYAINAAYALGRSIDDVIYAQLRGSAWTGENGATEIVLPPPSKVGVQFGENPAVNIGLTINKLIEAKRIRDAADNPEDEEWVIVVAAQQIADLLKTTEATSADYNTVKALVKGDIDTFMGFRFVLMNRIYVDGNDIAYPICYPKSAGYVGIGQNPTTRIDVLPTKKYSTQVFASMDIGAVRMEEVKVIEIACDQSP